MRDEWIGVMHYHGAGGARGLRQLLSDGPAADTKARAWRGHNYGRTRRAWDTADLSKVRSGGGKLRALAEAADKAGFEAWRRAWEAPAVFDDDMGLLGAGAPVEKGDKGESVEALQSTVADALIRKHGNRLCWNIEEATWHEFKAVWQKTPHRVGYGLAREWAKDALPSLGKASRNMVSKSGFYEGVEQIMRSALAVTQDAFDQDDWLLGTPGGTVELRTGLLRKARAGDMISLSTTVEPSAGEACPKWKKFIDWACTDGMGKVDAGMVRFLKQWAGYCLTGDVSNEMVVFLHGVGANGKGTFIETLQAVMGTYFFMAPKDLFMETKHGAHTEEIAALTGVRMVAADEVPVTSRWNESLLKAVSGSGKMTARHLYGRVLTFRIRFKVTISGNNKPTFQGEINEALKRRLHMAGFLQVAKPKSNTLKAELAAEGPGILRWMLNGLLDMTGASGGKVFVADSMIAATEDYFNENDLFGQWLGERVRKVKGGSAGAQDVFNDWTSWRNAQGNHFMFGRTNTFKAEMEKRGFLSVRTLKSVAYKGISIEMF
jgi:putative DNA primase/helicase